MAIASACGGAAIGTGQRVVRTGRTRINFELHASGGMPGWRAGLRRSFRDYTASAVLQEIDMLDIDVASTGIAPGRTEANNPSSPVSRS